MSANTLPAGWVRAPLGELTLPTSTRNPRADGKGEFAYIDIEAVDNQRQRITGARILENKTAPSRARNVVAAGDVIFSLVRPYLKNIAVIPSELGEAIASTAFFVCRPGTGVDSRFLFNFVRQNSFIASVVTYGNSPPSAHDDEFARLPIPLAPLKEQGRIADALDELLSDLDAGVAALELVRDKLKLYRAAVLKAAVEGALTGAQTPYPLRLISRGIESIGQGWSPKCERGPASDTEWGVIKTTAVQALRYLEEENKRLPARLTPRPHLELIAGDLLVTRAGPRSRVGVACVVKQTRANLMLCDKAYRLRFKEDQLLPAFVEVILNAPQFVDQLDKLKTGISDSGLNLTQNRFLALKIPFAPLDEQTVVVEAVEGQLLVIDHLEADLDARLTSSQALRQSILRHAFSGRLVPQDPNDEPASELLKRIAAEREQRAREAAAAKRLNGHKPRRPSKPRAAATKETDNGRIADR